jgi:TolB-like protein/tetratricopeptide (TPR) repeat protein
VARSLIAELRRRNVVRVAIAYLALGWVVVQVSQVVVPMLRLPEWTTTLLVWIGVVGLPFALAFAWIFELTPEGLRRESEVEHTDAAGAHRSRRLDLLIVALLVLAIGLFAFDRFVPKGERAAAPGTDAAEVGAPAAATPVAAATRKSIAVLPLVNMSDDKDNEFFGDGLAEELLNLLAQVPELRVAARTSSFHFKGKTPTIQEVAAALQVDTVLEGSVRRSGDTIRVVVQLISAQDGTHLWSEKYDRPLTEIFAVQDEIAGQIVTALLPQLGAGGAGLARRDTGRITPALYERFLRARHRLYDGTPAAVAFAHQELVAITSAAPDYAPGWAWLARSWLARCECRGGDVADDVARARAKEAVDTALGLDPREALAVLALGDLNANRGQLEEALREYDRAILLDPALVDAHIGRQWILALTGRPEEAIRSLETARAIDPLHPSVLYDLAHLLNLQGHKREAFATLETLYGISTSNARELELHLYSDNNEDARLIYLADLVVREGGDELPADRLGVTYLFAGFPDHPAVLASSYAPVALAMAGRREEALKRLPAEPKDAGELAKVTYTRLVLGDRDVLRDLLWQRWSALEPEARDEKFGATNRAVLATLLRQAGRTADAEPVAASLERSIAGMSPLHSVNIGLLKARLHVARGETEAAIAAYQALAAQGWSGLRIAEAVDLPLGDLDEDPRMQAIARQMKARIAAQKAELDRMRKSGMDAAAARREYVARLPVDPD